jgi:predicted Zn-dependent protease
MKLQVLLVVAAALASAQALKPPTISDRDEVRIGEVLARQFIAEEGMAPTPQITKIDQYLQSVGERVAAHAPRRLPYRFHFDPTPNFKSAVGLPGGQVFVGGGILAYIDSEDQLAAVLGHEIEHIALNQCRERLEKIMLEQHLSASDASKLKVDDFLPGYGHDKEFAADREGVKLASEAGYSGNAAVRLLQTYIILGQQMPNTQSEAKLNLEQRIGQIQGLHLPKTKEKPLAVP